MVDPVPSTCRFCTLPAISFCHHCGQDFCANHRSKYNNHLCVDCISDESIKTDYTTIKDDDGTTHMGNNIKLIGEGWPRSLEMIHKLTDEQLEAKIAELKKRVKEAQLTLDYSRILLSAAEFERAYSKHSKRVKLMRAQMIESKTEKQGTIRLNKKAHKVISIDDQAQLLSSQLNITIEQAKALMALAAAKKHGS